jgi:uncharacterized protein
MGEQTLLVVAVAIVMVVGLAGTVLPILPGIWLIWGAALVYGLASTHTVGGWVALTLITLLAGAGTSAAIYVPQRRATSVGIPWWGQVVATALAVVGLFLIPVVGAAIGFLLGIVGTTLVRTRDVGSAWDSSIAIVRSMLIASGIQVAVGVAMIGVWIVWVAVL